MIKNVSISKIKYLMFGINVISCLFIMLVIKNTTYTICLFKKAGDFLNAVQSLPVSPEKAFLYTLLLCAAFFITFILRRFCFSDKQTYIYISLGIDIILNILILKVTNCNYNGFMLWLLANIIHHVETSWRYPALVLGIFLYMFSSYDLVNTYYPLFSVQDYILFYPLSVSNVLFFILYTLSALNLIGFTVFCVNVIQEQKNTIEEINRLYMKLSRANEELKEYADIKEKMGETRERNRIAMEIHDSVGHSLTGISVGVDTCIAIMDKNPKAAKSQLQVISSVAKDGIADIRRSVSTLRPDSLNQTPLAETIKNMIEKTKQAAGIDIEFICYVTLDFNEEEENTVFRIIQESVTNAIRHGKATKIVIIISKEAARLEIIISDNGIGCENPISGFGITHMKERIEKLHGRLNLISHNGFTVEAHIPLGGSKND